MADHNQKSEFKESGEIPIREIFEVLWDKKIIILVATLIVSVLGYIYSISLTDLYESETLVISNNDGAQSPFSQLGGVASFIGAEIPSTGGEQVEHSIELMKSREFLKHLLQFEEVLPSIMAVDSFDEETYKIVFNSEIYDPNSKQWLKNNIFKGDPTYLKTHTIYKNDLLTINHDKLTGILRIKITHESPIFAKKLLELVIQETNNILRNIDLNESQEALSHLNEEISKTQLIQVKNSLFTLVQSQLERQMMAKINEDFALKIIDPPFIPESPSSPRRNLLLLLSAFFGSFLGIFFVLYKKYF